MHRATQRPGVVTVEFFVDKDGSGIFERDGRLVRYSLSDGDVMVACALMRGVLQRRLARLGRLSLVDQTTAELVELQ